MASLGDLFYNLHIQDFTQAEISAVNSRLSQLGTNIRLDPALFKSAIDEAVKNPVTVKVTPNITSKEVEDTINKSVISANITPVLPNLTSQISAAFAAAAPDASKLFDPTAISTAIRNTFASMDFTAVGTSLGATLEKTIKAKVEGVLYTVNIKIDETKLANHIKNAIKTAEKKEIDLKVSKNLKKTIEDAINNNLKINFKGAPLVQSISAELNRNPFTIQIKVLKDQARQAVQTAIGNASNITNAEALKYQRLMRGEASAARAELDKVRAAHIGAADAARTHASASSSVGNAMRGNIGIANELTNTFAGLYSIHTAKQFLSNIIEIGGELEHQKIALETIYGSESKMESLYSQIKGLARSSPFGVMDLTKNVKQLSAYGVAYNEVYDTAKRLADISAATSVDINRLILAFGKTKNRTFLDGLEAKQFAYANIPIYEELSKKLTELEGKFVSVKDVMGRIKKREIGFDMVKEILWDMTDEGGKFYNMQEKLAGSVKTSWKLVRDNIELMFGEMAEGPIGNWLKSLGQMLQGATRNWQTFSWMLSAGVAALSLYKIAVWATNAVLGKHNMLLAQSALAQSKETISKTVGVKVYRALTIEEVKAMQVKRAMNAVLSKNIFSAKVLTNAQLKLMMSEGMLTKEMALRLIATKKISLQQAIYLRQIGFLTTAEYKAAVAAAAHGKTIKALGISATFSAARFKILGAAIWSSIKTMGAYIFNWGTAAMAVIGAVIALWQNNARETERAKEVSDSVFNKAVDGAQELKALLEGMKPSKELSDLELTQGIEKMETALKDLSPTPIKDINETLVSQDGHLLTLAERYDALIAKVNGLKDAFDDVSADGMNTMIQNALEYTNEGWFNDDLLTNAKDYENALKRRQSAINEFATAHREAMVKAIDAALETDEGFKNAAKGMNTYEAKLKLLTENTEKYTLAVSAFTNKLSTFDGVGSMNDLANASQIEAALNELESDNQKFIESMNTQMRSLNLDPSLLTKDIESLTDKQKEDVEKMRRILEVVIKEAFDKSAESIGEEGKKVMLKGYRNAWGDILSDENIGTELCAKFRDIATASTDDFTKTAVTKLQYEGFDALSDAEKKVVKKLMGDAKTQVMGDLELTNNEMAAYLAAHPLVQLITLAFANDAPGSLAKELVAKHGYPGLIPDTKHYVEKWTKSNNIYESRNAARDDLQAAYNELKAAEREGGEIYKRAKEEYDKIKNSLAYLEWTDIEVKDQKSNKHTGTKSKKDLVAERFKQRFKDLKDAWAEYQKWQKSIGDEAAAAKVADSGLFGDMSAEDIPRTAEQFKTAVEKLKRELESAGVKGHSQRESLLNEYIKHILDIDKSMVDERINSAIETVERSFEQQMEDFNLFKKIRKATGNEDLAFAFSFGLDGGNKDYIKMVKEQFNELSRKAKEVAPDIEILDFDKIDEDNVVKLPDALQKAWKEATKNIANYKKEQRNVVADALSEHQTTMEEIVALQAEAAEKIQKIRESMESGDLSRVKNGNIIGQNLIEDIKVNLNFEIFKRSGEYLKFFNASLALTADTAEEIGAKIKENLNKELQKSQISAKEYCDEMEKINKILKEIRSKQSGFGDFMKGGLSNIFEQNYKDAEAKRNAAATDYDNAAQKFNLFSKEGNEAGMQQAQAAMDAASAMGEGASAAMGAAQGGMDTMATIDTIVHGINDTVQGIKGSFDLIRDMADSFGADTGADTDWGAAGAFLDAFSQASQYATDAWDSLKSGNVGGVIQGVVGSITSWFTVFNRWHDEKLQAQIEKSKEVVQNIQYAYDAIERRLDRFLGNRRNLSILDVEKDKRSLNEIDKRIAETKNRIEKGNYHAFGVKALEGRLNVLNHQRDNVNKRVQAYETGGALGYQRQLMTEQLAELEKQKSLEESKKKSDSAAISDYADQIDEMRVQILQFAEEMASETYGVDLNDWAEQIGDSLVDAFARGEDAAEAFDSTVSDILRSLVGKMISQDIIAPMFNDLKNYLFGEYGNTGAYGEDFQLDASEVAAMKTYLDKIRDEGIPAAENLFNAINEATGGILSDTESASNGVSAGIQSVTEDTASLLASYINAIRAYCAENSLNFDQLVKDCMPRLTVIAEAQLTQLNMIAENTRRNMMAAEAIQQSNQTIADLFRAATKSKDHGLYIR